MGQDLSPFSHLSKHSPAPGSQDPHLRGSSGKVHRRPPFCPSSSIAASVETLASGGGIKTQAPLFPFPLLRPIFTWEAPDPERWVSVQRMEK